MMADSGLSRCLPATPTAGLTGNGALKGRHAPHGDPVTNDELIAKYRALVGQLLPAGRRTPAAVLTLDELTDVRELAELVAAPVASALG
jgi:hypothetical protein